MIARLLTLGVCATLLSAAGAADNDKSTGKASAFKLEGQYTIVTGQRDGKNIPDEEVRGSKVRFTKDRIVATDKDGKDLYVATYKLDTAQKPWRITMVSVAPKEGVKAEGLIEKQSDDTLRLVYNLPGGQAPDDFKADKNQQMFILKAYEGDKNTPKAKRQ